MSIPDVSQIRKTAAFNLLLIRQQVLKGPDRLLRAEIALQLAKAYTLTGKENNVQKFEPSFEDLDIFLSLNAFNEIVSSIMFKNHRMNYQIPIEKLYEHLEHIFDANNDVEKAAIMFLFKRKSIECVTRIWTRELEFARKINELSFHYRDMDATGGTLRRLRGGDERRNSNFKIKPVFNSEKKNEE